MHWSFHRWMPWVSVPSAPWDVWRLTYAQPWSRNVWTTYWFFTSTKIALTTFPVWMWPGHSLATQSIVLLCLDDSESQFVSWLKKTRLYCYWVVLCTVAYSIDLNVIVIVIVTVLLCTAAMCLVKCLNSTCIFPEYVYILLILHGATDVFAYWCTIRLPYRSAGIKQTISNCGLVSDGANRTSMLVCRGRYAVSWFR